MNPLVSQMFCNDINNYYETYNESNNTHINVNKVHLIVKERGVNTDKKMTLTQEFRYMKYGNDLKKM